MKRTFILTTLTALSAVLIFTSCKPSRVYATKDRNDDYEREERRYTPPPPPPRYNTPAPRYNSHVSLIISPTPGFTMNRHSNGLYFHRSPNGFMYWKGYDNRFYLDRGSLSRVNYSKREYSEWKRYSRSSR